ncbi:MAG: hypothetical protein ACPGVU_21055 [Limisphaerales bacterium]
MNLKTFLALSLAANVVLAFVLNRKSEPDTGPSPAPEPSTPAAVPKTDSKPTPVVQTPEPQKIQTTNVLEKTFGWEAVESPDYMEYIKNLRSVGCPDETIRDIIIADVNKLYEQKKKELPVKRKEFEFWKPGLGGIGTIDTEYQAAVKGLEEEKNNLLRALGIEPDLKQSQMATLMNPMDAMMSFLDEGKKVKVMAVFSQAQEKMMKIDAKGQDRMVEIFKMQREMEDSVAKILTPEENQDFLMRFSMTANLLRNQIDGFDPSKEEFLQVFELRREHENTYSPIARMTETPDEKVQREEAEKLLKERMKQSLGEERFNDYEMSQDHKFQRAYSAAKRSGLSVNEAKTAWQMQNEAQKQAKNLRGNTELSAAARQTALEQIRNEAMTSIKELYGEQGWQNYQRGSGAVWLEQMVK